MTPYEQLENEVAARLQPLVDDGHQVQVMPETTEEYVKPPLDKGSIIVAYIASDFDTADGVPRVASIDTSSTEEYLRIELTLRSRKLRGTGGIHDLRDRAQARLLGFTPSNYDKLKLRAFTYFAFTESVWAYKLVFWCKGFIAEVPDPVDEPLTTQITVDEITVST